MTLIKNKSLLCTLSLVFLAIEGWIGIQLFTQTKFSHVHLQFSAVALAFLFCFVFFESSKAYIFTQFALLFTLISDYFLVLRGAEEKTVAMIFFSIAQIFYFLRIYSEDTNQKRKKAHLILRAILCIASLPLTAVVLGDKLDMLAPITVFYFVNLALNVIFAYLNFGRSPILAIGLTLFILCDITIGISGLGMYFPLDKESLIYKIFYPGFDLVWFFYLPSQALLSVSLLTRRFARKSK